MATRKKKTRTRKKRRPMRHTKRRFVVVYDNSPEAQVSLRFASARASHVDGGSLVLFHAFPPGEFQHWMAVQEKTHQESKEEAREIMKKVATEVEEEFGIAPEIVIREGDPKEELQNYMKKARYLFALFLGAHSEGEPGPLVDYFSGPLVGSLRCPVVIVPGSLTKKQIDAMA